MGRIIERDNMVDVICQHSRDGTIIPIKLRVEDEDGEYQQFLIRSYRDLTNYNMDDRQHISKPMNHMWTFECCICVFGKEKKIRLLYNSGDNLWRIVSV